MQTCEFCLNPIRGKSCLCSFGTNGSKVKSWMPDFMLDSIVKIEKYPNLKNFSKVALNIKSAIIFKCTKCDNEFRLASSTHPQRAKNKDKQMVCFNCLHKESTGEYTHLVFRVSFLELQILYILKELLPNSFSIYHSYDCSSLMIKNKLQIDFFLPSLNLAFEVDPFFTHKLESKVKRDKLLTEAIMSTGVFTHFVRFRDSKLPRETYPYYIYTSNSGKDDATAIDFCEAICSYLKTELNVEIEPLYTLSVEQLRMLRSEARKEWERIRLLQGDKPLKDRSGYKRPVSLKNCKECLKDFKSSDSRRRFCSSRCSSTYRERTKRNKGLQGKQPISITHPEASLCLIENKSHPEFGADRLTYGSRDICSFKCSCGYEATVEVNKFVSNFNKQHIFTKRHLNLNG